MNAKNKGSILILTVILCFSLATVIVSYMQSVTDSAKYVGASNIEAEALYAANAGIEDVKYLVKSSTYSASGNDWLIANSSPTGMVAISDLAVSPNYKVSVSIIDLQNGLHTAVSNAYYYASPTDETGVFSARVELDIRGRDLFSKFMFFIDNDSINVGTTTMRGDMHSNKTINFTGGGAKMYGDVTARTGITYTSGATKSNTSFFGDVNPAADLIAWPSTNEIATLHNDASDVYDVTNTSPAYQGMGNFNTEIEFIGNTVKITAKKTTNGAILKTGIYPLPANNLIFVQGAITSLKGDINGRTTIACMDKVDITGNIRYQDAAGNMAYQLTKDGNVVTSTPAGVAWNEADGYFYKENPSYDKTNPSTLGIMALKNITIAPTAPYNMELHAAMFSSTGNWNCDLSTKKGNLKVMGSITEKLGSWRYNTAGYGYAKSGEYLYDEMLLASPPPHFLQVDTPLFGSWRKTW